MIGHPQADATLLERYIRGPAELAAVVAGLTRDQLALTAHDDSWTVRQLVHHIVDGDLLWTPCIKMALAPRPPIFSIPWYWEREQVDWGHDWHYDTRGIDTVLELFSANRRAIGELLAQVDHALDRTVRVQFPDQRVQTADIRRVVRMQTDHVAGHIADIHTILGTP